MSDQRFKKPEDRVISFGQYKGYLYSEVPDSYLRWFARNAYHQLVNRRQWAVDELRRRELKAGVLTKEEGQDE